MTLRHRIHNEISAGRLKPQWTCGDLKENSRLSSRYKQSSLGSTPANQSRSAPGLNLEDGKHSEDYYYYVRVGKRGNALLFELRPDALEPFTSTAADIEDFPSAIIDQDSKTFSRRGEHQPTTLKWTSAQLHGILDTLNGDPKRLVRELHAKFRRGELENEDAWYQASYLALIAHGNPRSLKGFIRVIAHAYSWLPTNKAKAFPTEHSFKELRTAVRNFGSVKTVTSRRTIIRAAQNAICVSEFAVITISKVLHFWDPQMAPMYDINVKRALKSMPQTWTIDWFDIDQGIANYIHYWQLADRLIEESNSHAIGRLNYRSLDELLFKIGRMPTAKDPKSTVAKRGVKTKALARG